MVKNILKITDLVLSVIAAKFFLIVVFAMFAGTLFRKQPKAVKGVTELYISIIDFRDSVLSTYKDDIVMDGFISKCFAYHFDFDKTKDEQVRISENVVLENVSVHPDCLIARIGFTKTIAALVGIRTFLRMFAKAVIEQVNIIRAQDPHLLGFNAYALSRMLGVPYIVQICSNYELKDRQAKGITFRPFIFKSVERAFERFIMKRADLVLTDREHYRSFGLIPRDIPADRYGNMGFFADSIHYTPPEARNNLRLELGISSDKKILLYVGRLAAVKYPADLLKMLAEVCKRRKGTVLLVAGSGPLKDYMMRMSKEFKVGSNAIFMDTVTQRSLSDLYSTADIVCFTSAGFTMIEAALAEKCIIAYDFEWHDEFIGKNERGILVPFGDYRKFADEVLGLLDDEARLKSLGKAARIYALKNYTRQAAVGKEIGFYKAVFRKRGIVI